MFTWSFNQVNTSNNSNVTNIRYLSVGLLSYSFDELINIKIYLFILKFATFCVLQFFFFFRSSIFFLFNASRYVSKSKSLFSDQTLKMFLCFYESNHINSRYDP